MANLPGFPRGQSHPRAIDLVERRNELRAKEFGMLRIVTVFRDANSRLVARTSCAACRMRKSVLVDNLASGKIRNCICQRQLKYGASRDAARLAKRYDAIKQRCRRDSSNPLCRNYGHRGIECRISREEFVQHVLGILKGTSLGRLDIDRIDNDGHYEIGNLRLATRRENLRNRRNSSKVRYLRTSVPTCDLWGLLKRDFPEFNLSQQTTGRLARKGLTAHEILSRTGRTKSHN